MQVLVLAHRVDARARAPPKLGQHARVSDAPPVSFRVPLTAESRKECPPSTPQAISSFARAPVGSAAAAASCASPLASAGTTRSVLYSPITVQSPKALFPAPTSPSAPELSPSKASSRFSPKKYTQKHRHQGGERTATRTVTRAHSFECVYDV